MARIRRRMTDDNGGGRQLDLWATLIISLVVGALGVLNVVNEAVVASATLATLGLLAVASLAGRVQIAALTSTVADLAEGADTRYASADRLLSTSTSGADLDLDGAMDVRILGVTLARTVRGRYDELERRLRHGAAVRVAMIAPRAEVLAEAARRSTVGEAPEIFSHRLRPTLDLLAQLGRTAGPGRLEVRLLDFVPAFGLTAVDPDESRGLMRVDIYSHRATAPEPTLTLHADRDRHWYAHFSREFDRVWSAAVPVGGDDGHSAGDEQEPT